MEEEFFNRFDSLEVVSLAVSAGVVIIAIYRWLLIKWQSEVNLRSYVFMHGLGAKHFSEPFKVHLDVPEEQEVSLIIEKDKDTSHCIHDGILKKGSHEISVSMKEMTSGDYRLILKSDGQEDMKLFSWKA